MTGLECLREEMLKRGCTKAQTESKGVMSAERGWIKMTRYIDADKITYTPSVPIAVISQIVNAGREEDAKHLFHVSRADIDAQPTIDAVPQWIPCNERLPEEDCETGKGVQYSDFVLMSVDHKEDEETIVDYGHTVDGKWYSDYTDCFIPQEWKVTAWMPLPKPYEVKE